VKHIEVPQFQGLSVGKVLAKYKPPHKIYEYLPDDLDDLCVNRSFVFNVSQFNSSFSKVINTVDPGALKEFVSQIVSARKTKIYSSESNQISLIAPLKQAIM